MSYILTMNQLGGGGGGGDGGRCSLFVPNCRGGGGRGCLLCCRLDVNAMDDRVLVSADLLTVNAKFDHDYTDLKISETANILAIEVKGHLNNNYQNHINISLRVCLRFIRQWSRIRHSWF